MGLDPRGQTPNHGLERAMAKIKAHQAKVKAENDQIVANYESQQGAAGEELARLKAGGTDFTLFNLVLQKVDFTVMPANSSHLDYMRALYHALWPYMAKLIKENAFFRDTLPKLNFDTLDPVSFERIEQIYSSENDPNAGAKAVLEQIKEAAKRRSKLKLY